MIHRNEQGQKKVWKGKCSERRKERERKKSEVKEVRKKYEELHCSVLMTLH